MLDVFGFPTPQSANFQEFYGGGTYRDWVKPRGASMVRMLLIGAGAGGRSDAGGGGTGGGSGAVTSWIGPAIFIPDVIRIYVGPGGAADTAGGQTLITYHRSNSANGYTLLQANGANSNAAGTASASNYFGAAGIYFNVSGQAGAPTGTNAAASTSTFLCGGAGGAGNTTAVGGAINTRYGYSALSGGAGTTGGAGKDGFFLTQPLMFGMGGAGGGGSTTAIGGAGGRGGIGCGGGGGGMGTSGAAAGGRGGDGAVFIWSW